MMVNHVLYYDNGIDMNRHHKLCMKMKRSEFSTG